MREIQTAENDGRELKIQAALEAIRKIQKRTGSITAEELLSARDEGRK